MTHDTLSYFEIGLFYTMWTQLYRPCEYDDKDDSERQSSTYERRNGNSSYSACTASIQLSELMYGKISTRDLPF